MSTLKSRLAHVEQAGSRGKPIIVVVGPDETREQAFARAGIDRTKLHPDQLVIIMDRGCQHAK